MVVLLIIVLAFIVIVVIAMSMSPGDRDGLLYGPLNTAFICPHCQEKGHVRTKPIKKKAGISGAKATGALLTGGLSILATGLSRKENLTEAHCCNCNTTWHF